MSLNWGQIYHYAKLAVGEPTAWPQEAYDHLTEALRRVCGLKEVEVPELMRTTTVTLTAQNPAPLPPAYTYLDHFAVDPQIYFIDSIYNQTDGYPVLQEPSGMRGRNHYLDTTGQPPPGNVTFWVRDANDCYVRNTPSKDTALVIRYGLEVPPVDSSMANQHPITPDHYDWALVHAAVSSYFAVHPDQGGAVTKDESDRAMTRYQLAEKRFADKIAQPKDVYNEEAKSAFVNVRLAGYRPYPRSRRAR